jgi:hypothetical protein
MSTTDVVLDFPRRDSKLVSSGAGLWWEHYLDDPARIIRPIPTGLAILSVRSTAACEQVQTKVGGGLRTSLLATVRQRVNGALQMRAPADRGPGRNLHHRARHNDAVRPVVILPPAGNTQDAPSSERAQIRQRSAMTSSRPPAYASTPNERH